MRLAAARASVSSWHLTDACAGFGDLGFAAVLWARPVKQAEPSGACSARSVGGVYNPFGVDPEACDPLHDLSTCEVRPCDGR